MEQQEQHSSPHRPLDITPSKEARRVVTRIKNESIWNRLSFCATRKDAWLNQLSKLFDQERLNLQRASDRAVFVVQILFSVVERKVFFWIFTTCLHGCQETAFASMQNSSLDQRC